MAGDISAHAGPGHGHNRPLQHRPLHCSSRHEVGIPKGGSANDGAAQTLCAEGPSSDQRSVISWEDWLRTTWVRHALSKSDSEPCEMATPNHVRHCAYRMMMVVHKSFFNRVPAWARAPFSRRGMWLLVVPP